MRLLLSSRGFATQKLSTAFFGLLPIKEKLKVSIITTASEEYKEKNKYAQGLKHQLEKRNIQSKFVDLEFQSPMELGDSDAIILSGGNPYFLLHHIKRSGADKILQRKMEENCALYGISAGFLVFQKDITIIDFITPEMNKLNLQDKSGLGFIDEVVLPHYDRFVKEGLINPEDINRYEQQTKKKVLRLGELEGILYLDGKKV